MQSIGKQFGSPQKLNTELPCDQKFHSSILKLYIYLNVKSCIQCSEQRYSSQLKWKQPRCPCNEQKNQMTIWWDTIRQSKCMMCSYMIQHGWPLVSHGRSHCPLYEMSKINESIETESRLGIAKKAEEEEWEGQWIAAYCQGPSSLRGGWTCSEIRCTVLWIYKTLLSWHFKMVNFMRCVNYISIFNWEKNFLIMKKILGSISNKITLAKLYKMAKLKQNVEDSLENTYWKHF